MARPILTLAFIALLLASCAAPAGAVPRAAEARTAAELFRSPTCECCSGHGDYLIGRGFDVRWHEVADISSIKQRLSVPELLWSCHTTVIEGYVIEGHVPIEAIARVLAERPDIDGIALPGMPAGSPGMGGARDGPWEVFAFANGESWVYLEI